MSTLDFEKSEKGKSEGSGQEGGFTGSLESCTGELDDSVDSLMEMVEESGGSSMDYEARAHKEESSADSDLHSTDGEESSDLNDMEGYVSGAHIGTTIDPLKGIADIDAAMESEEEEEEREEDNDKQENLGGDSTDDAEQDTLGTTDEGNVSSEKEDMSKEDEGSKEANDMGKEDGKTEKKTSEAVKEGEGLVTDEEGNNVEEEVEKDESKSKNSPVQDGENVNNEDDRNETEEAGNKVDDEVDKLVVKDKEKDTNIEQEAMEEDVVMEDKEVNKQEEKIVTEKEQKQEDNQESAKDVAEVSSVDDKEESNDNTPLSQNSNDKEANSDKDDTVTPVNVIKDAPKKKPAETTRIILLSSSGQPLKLKTKPEEEASGKPGAKSGSILITTKTEKGKDDQKSAGGNEGSEVVPVLCKKNIPNIKDIKIGKISTSTCPVKAPSQFVVIPYSKDGTAKLMTQTLKSPSTQQDKTASDNGKLESVNTSPLNKTKKTVPMVTLPASIKKVETGKVTDTQSKNDNQGVSVKCVRVAAKPETTKENAGDSPSRRAKKKTAATAPKKMVSNVIQIKRKLEEIMGNSKTEEEESIKELQKMKREKTDILNQITKELEKLKQCLVSDNMEEQ